MYDDAGLEAFVTSRIIEIFESAGMSTYKFSEITGIPRTTVRDYLNGKVHPSVYFIGVCCNCLGLTQAEFYRTYDARNCSQELADIAAASIEATKIQQVYAVRMLENINKKLDTLTVKVDSLN